MSSRSNTQGTGGAGTGSGSGGAGTGSGSGGTHPTKLAAVLLVVVVVGLAALVAGAGNDPYRDPAWAAAFPLALLVLFPVTALVVGSTRRRI